MMQEQLNAITVNRINEKINLSQSYAVTQMKQAIEDASNIEDKVIPVGKRNNSLSFLYDDELVVYQGPEEYGINDHALNQYATRVGIPTAYIFSLLQSKEMDKKLLGTQILNKHAQFSDSTRLLTRSVNKQIRGILSDRYKRLDSVRILSAFIDASTKAGAVVVDGHYSQTKVFLEMILPNPIIIDTPNNGLVSLAFGARLSTSDYGDGKLDLRSFILNGVCLNGMVRESVMDKIHLGKQIDSSIHLSNRTYELESKAASSAINDFTESILNTEYIGKRIEEVYMASSTPVDMEKEIVTLQKSAKITKDEQADILSLLIKNDEQDGVQGDSTLWKLQQGITAYARTSNEVRSRELQEIAGNMSNKFKIK